MSSSSRIIVALDYSDPRSALALIERLNPEACRLKVGFELFVTAGPDFVGDLVERGFDVFLDLKFHDIPNTVAAVCKVAAQLGVWMINVHASGGVAMMRAAREALETQSSRPLLIAVTVLTSLDTADLKQIGFGKPASEQALELAVLAQDSALDGVVCSAVEAPQMRERLGDDFVLVTPGIRPAQGEQGDQKRVMTPVDAIRAGSHYLVMGRPITGAADPVAALAAINADLARLT